jgi:uncharacterized protein YndB with AHSA1/START domain
MPAEMTPDTVYVTYIGASAEKVWDALTQATFTKQYFFGMRVESDWREGSSWSLYKPDGARQVSGRVLIADRPRKLRVSWNVDGIDLPACIVTYDIEPDGDAVKLTMTEHHPALLDPKWLEGGKQGWPKILSGLKTLLETGAPLRMGPPRQPQ